MGEAAEELDAPRLQPDADGYSSKRRRNTRSTLGKDVGVTMIRQRPQFYSGPFDAVAQDREALNDAYAHCPPDAPDLYPPDVKG